MDFRQLKYLTTVAEYRSITKAADALFISQSAMSHYIKKAEEEFGIQLFDRSTTPLSLTFAGQKYMESARKILLENDRLMKEFRDITHHMTGVLRIGTSRDRSSYMLPRLIPPFSELYPYITLEIITGSGQQLMEALRIGKIDLVLLPNSGSDSFSGIEMQHIYSEELILAASASRLNASYLLPGRQDAVDPKTLNGMPFFLTLQGHVIRTFCDSYFRKQHIHPQVKMEFSSNITCYRMASTGMGLAIIPYLTTQIACCSHPIRLYSLGRERTLWNVSVMYRKDSYLGQPECDFIRISKEIFSSEYLS